DSMNYIPVYLQNQANPAGSKEVIDIDVQTKEAADLMVVSSTSLTGATRKATVSEKIATSISKSADDIMTFRKELDALALKHLGPVPTTAPTSTNPVNTGSDNLNTGFEEVTLSNIEAISPSADHEEEVFSDADDDEMPKIRIYDKSSEGIFEKASYDDDGIISDFNNPTGRAYNFSKLIFDGMMANLKNKKKFLMYPRFLQLILNIQTENKHPYLAVSLTKKIFGNMKRGFQGAHRPLLPSMLLVATNPTAGQEHAAQAPSQPSSSSPTATPPPPLPTPTPPLIPTPTPLIPTPIPTPTPPLIPTPTPLIPTPIQTPTPPLIPTPTPLIPTPTPTPPP
ncbi:hypothetical protein Tco_1167463, partial [Tanacetum coccineum]